MSILLNFLKRGVLNIDRPRTLILIVLLYLHSHLLYVLLDEHVNCPYNLGSLVRPLHTVIDYQLKVDGCAVVSGLVLLDGVHQVHVIVISVDSC